MESKLVSVIIHTYERSNHLKKTIKSVISQNYKNIEIIVVDDNEPNSKERKDVVKVLNELNVDKEIIYIQHINNFNGAVARNTGLAASSGKYITFLDDDDELTVNKISNQVNFLIKNKEFKACYCLTYYAFNNEIYNKSTFNISGDFSYDVFLLRHQCNTSTFLFKRKDLVALEGFRENFNRHQDVELLIRFFNSIGKIGCANFYGVIRNVDDRTNMPSINSFIETKKAFLQQFSEDIESLDKKKRKKIKDTHKIDIFLYSLRMIDIKKSFKYFPNPLVLMMYLLSERRRLVSFLKRKIASNM